MLVCDYRLPQFLPIKTDPEWESADGERMKFRLTYEGPLPAASQSDTRANDKRRIREALHPQLRRLWKVHPTLKDLKLPERVGGARTLQSRHAVDVLGDNFERCGYHFVPLISQVIGHACKISILFLRPEQPGQQLIKSGDIDNRIKVLFDALRIPKDRNEIGDATPTADQEPFYCLLEDDSLINHLEIETDLMLQEVDGRYDENHVRLIIEVESIRVGDSWIAHFF